MQDGDRVLTAAEWGLFRVGLGDLWDLVEDDVTEDIGLSATGVQVFDALQPEQKLALLADVGQALRDPAIPTPRHTAANEGAIAAVFATVRQALVEEIECAAEKDSTPTEVRALLLAAAADEGERPDDWPAAADGDGEAWDVLPAITKWATSSWTALRTRPVSCWPRWASTRITIWPRPVNRTRRGS
jgi:hypothetical protein